MSKLLVKPAGRRGRIHHVTPESAGWRYVGFDVHMLAPGETVSGGAAGREVCLVLVTGKAKVSVDGRDFGEIGERMSPFEGAPSAVYVPAGAPWHVAATTNVELAVCSAPGQPGREARVIGPDKVARETRGRGTNTRHVANILPEGEPADSLLVVEVITPSGHWSSYPPHKHDATRCRTSRCSRRRTTTASTRRRATPCSGSTRTTAPSTRRSPSRTATSPWCRAATTRSARRMATRSTTST